MRRYCQPAISMRSRGSDFGARLVIDRVVAAFAQLEAELLAVLRMLQVAAEVADLAVRRLVDADEADLLRVATGRRRR